MRSLGGKANIFLRGLRIPANDSFFLCSIKPGMAVYVKKAILTRSK